MLIRFLILGAEGVGKSFLVSCLSRGCSPEENFGSDAEAKFGKLTVGELKVQVCGDSYVLPIFDESNPNRNALPELDVILNLAQEADCIFFIYSISNPESFNRVKCWLQKLQEELSGISVVLVGNYSGIPSEQVSYTV